MSTDNQSVIVRDSYSICFAETVSDAQQQSITQLLNLLPIDSFDLVENFNSTDSAKQKQPIIIKNMVDGRGLACPMPLLKTKVALREVAVGESLYVVATDPNSQADISAFCQQSQQTGIANPLLLLINQATAASSGENLEAKSKDSIDTIYHFIITKTDSN
ncbi:sulfurtransferase TusA family protein [Psychrobacter sp. M9-54-1]|uniref:sulfurtransferase TusA family protein n=1 Tax=Psychrobacter sp. M9-54-1 TaxID=2782386 RepID=UPI00190CF236|nr:sulfurtransferase TusA family protein [Psychrobacter sp. M9-54-1]MBK3393540.1 sulfurtransferase TusA family protein [Psychrobacter sp. M9-54-1]